MSHVIRLSMPKSWPLPRKGTKYLACPMPGKKSEISIPLVIVLRDILKIGKTRKEVKAIMHEKNIEVNGKITEELKLPLSLFDLITIPKIKKSFIVLLSENGKLELKETKDINKICKVVCKKMLSKNRQQLNCLDGRNIITQEKVGINDSIVVDLKSNKILKVLPFKEKSEVFIIGGSNIGNTGKIEKIDGKKVMVNIKNKMMEVQAKNLHVIQ